MQGSEIVPRRTQQFSLLHWGNTIRRASKKSTSAHSDFDEHNRASIPHDEIDLSKAAPVIPRDKYKILLPQKPLRILLRIATVQSYRPSTCFTNCNTRPMC